MDTNRATRRAAFAALAAAAVGPSGGQRAGRGRPIVLESGFKAEA